MWLAACLFLSGPVRSDSLPDEGLLRMMREGMVESQLRARGIQDERVLEVMGALPRENFIAPSIREQAYDDSPLSIGFGQTISQPYVVAYMTELLEVQPQDKVLEVGTGSGYQAAVLARLAKEVYTIEIVPELYEAAQTQLLRMGCRNIHFLRGDGWKGWPEAAPFDKIMVTAAPDQIPQALKDQLKEGGRLVIPVGRHHDVQQLLIGIKRGENVETVDTISVRFVPLVRGSQDPSKDAQKGS